MKQTMRPRAVIREARTAQALHCTAKERCAVQTAAAQAQPKRSQALQSARVHSYWGPPPPPLLLACCSPFTLLLAALAWLAEPASAMHPKRAALFLSLRFDARFGAGAGARDLSFFYSTRLDSTRFGFDTTHARTHAHRRSSNAPSGFPFFWLALPCLPLDWIGLDCDFGIAIFLERLLQPHAADSARTHSTQHARPASPRPRHAQHTAHSHTHTHTHTHTRPRTHASHAATLQRRCKAASERPEGCGMALACCVLRVGRLAHLRSGPCFSPSLLLLLLQRILWLTLPSSPLRLAVSLHWPACAHPPHPTRANLPSLVRSVVVASVVVATTLTPITTTTTTTILGDAKPHLVHVDIRLIKLTPSPPPLPVKRRHPSSS